MDDKDYEEFYGTLMKILDDGVKAYDDYICALPTRHIYYDNAVNLAAIRDNAVETARVWLDQWTELAPPAIQRPLENGMIAEILFNFRFLWYIYGTCGDRKRGWVVRCHELILEVIRHSEPKTEVKNDVTAMPSL